MTVLPIGFADQVGYAEIVLAEDFLNGSRIGNAVIADTTMYGPEFQRAGRTGAITV